MPDSSASLRRPLDRRQMRHAVAHQVHDHEVEAAAAQQAMALSPLSTRSCRRPVQRRQGAVDRGEIILANGEQQRPPNRGRSLIQFARNGPDSEFIGASNAAVFCIVFNLGRGLKIGLVF
jgi:hypothetical protein